MLHDLEEFIFFSINFKFFVELRVNNLLSGNIKIFLIGSAPIDKKFCFSISTDCSLMSL